MGLWSNGTPLSWEEAKKHADHVRKHGIKQSLAIYRKLKDRQNDSLLCGVMRLEDNPFSLSRPCPGSQFPLISLYRLSTPS